MEIWVGAQWYIKENYPSHVFYKRSNYSISLFIEECVSLDLGSGKGRYSTELCKED